MTTGAARENESYGAKKFSALDGYYTKRSDNLMTNPIDISIFSHAGWSITLESRMSETLQIISTVFDVPGYG